MSPQSWSSLYHALQMKLLSGLSDRCAIGRQRTAELEGQPPKVGIGFILAMHQLIGAAYFSSESKVSSTELMLPSAVETFADLENIKDKPHVKGLVYRNIRLVKS